MVDLESRAEFSRGSDSGEQQDLERRQGNQKRPSSVLSLESLVRGPRHSHHPPSQAPRRSACRTNFFVSTNNARDGEEIRHLPFYGLNLQRYHGARLLRERHFWPFVTHLMN